MDLLIMVYHYTTFLKWNVIILVRLQIGGGGFYPRRYAKLSMCFWFIGKGSDGFKNFNVCILKILYNIKDSCCGIEIVLFLKSSFGLWIYWDWRLCELNGKIGIFLSMLIVVRVKYSLWSQVFLSHASYVYGVSGRYEKYKWLVIMDIYGMVTKKGIYLEWGNRVSLHPSNWLSGANKK